MNEKKQAVSGGSLFFRILAGISSLLMFICGGVIIFEALNTHKPIPRQMAIIFVLPFVFALYAIRGETGNVSVSNQNLDGGISATRFWGSIIFIIVFCVLIGVLLILESR
jgi:hypothetical protein